jgi:hypothetical protein
MAKQRPDKKQTSSEKMLSLKPPIHRIAANSIMKNAPVKKDLFKITVPVAAARMQPKHIGGFRKYAKEYGVCDAANTVTSGMVEKSIVFLEMATQS